MKKGETILVIPPIDFNGKKGSGSQSVFNTVIPSFSEKFFGEIQTSAGERTIICFLKPENAIQFALNAASRFHQLTEIPVKMGVDFQDKEDDNPADEIASRLSDACPVNSILVSGSVYESLLNHAEFKFILVGSTLFKGRNKPTEIYAIAERGLYIPAQNELMLGEKNKNSIAVLPFHNTSSENELDYICDGIAEEIIDSLSRSTYIFVTARSSSFLFKNKEMSISDISRKLNVNFILDGSIRKRNDEYRISYQLVDCSQGYNIISDTISSDFDSLYDSEKKISKSITGYFTKDEPETIQEEENSYSINPRAYSFYLQGKHLSQQWNSDSAGAINLFKKALEIEPGFALAYAGMSICHTHMALNGYGDFRENITNAIINADKSIEADNSIPDGYTAKALASFWMGNWFVPDFEKNITSALAISPCNAEIRMFNGMVFLIKGELKRALIELLLARQLDPYSSGVKIRLGLAQYLNREYEAAHNTYLLLLHEDVNKTYHVLRLACCCIMLKQYNKALEYLDMGTDNYEYHNMKYGIYLATYKGLKDEDNFYKTRSLIEQLPEHDTSTYYNKAVLNMFLGRHELSIQYLEKMLQNPLFYLMFLQHDEFWEVYHDHPLFIELIDSKYKGTGNQLIKIESDTKEFIELKITDFLYAEAQDNYTCIVYKEKKGKKDKILRTTLSNVEKQLNLDEIVRCHRSYIINIGAGYTFVKSENKSLLKHPEFGFTVPVSRSNEKELKERLQN